MGQRCGDSWGELRCGLLRGHASVHAVDADGSLLYWGEDVESAVGDIHTEIRRRPALKWADELGSGE